MAMVMEVKNMSFFSAEPTVDVAGKVLDEFSDVEGLKEVIKSILALEDSEVYEKLVHVRFDGLMGSDVEIDRSEDEFSSLEKFAIENLSKFPLSIPLAPLIGIKEFLVSYSFIAGIYHVNLGRKLNLEDRNKIFHSSMATRIVSLLEDFDSDIETPNPSAEFFKRLGKIKWQNKQAKRLFSSLVDLRLTLVYEKWGGGGSISTFLVTEDAFILLLSGCSAVIYGRDKINTFDVIKANKTYLKLINTDITRLM
jgi:hypothetical protein